jgi:heat shock protein HslJ
VRERPRRRRLRGLAVAGLAALAGATAAACARRAASVPARAPTLVGTEWLLVDLGGRAVVDGAQATLAFVDSVRVAGRATCNRFHGPLVIDGERVVRAGPFAGTRMACVAEALAEQETRYLRALGEAERVEHREPYLLVHVRGLEKPLRFTLLAAPR